MLARAEEGRKRRGDGRSERRGDEAKRDHAGEGDRVERDLVGGRERLQEVKLDARRDDLLEQDAERGDEREVGDAPLKRPRLCGRTGFAGAERAPGERPGPGEVRDARHQLDGEHAGDPAARPQDERGPDRGEEPGRQPDGRGLPDPLEPDEDGRRDRVEDRQSGDETGERPGAWRLASGHRHPDQDQRGRPRRGAVDLPGPAEQTAQHLRHARRRPSRRRGASRRGTSSWRGASRAGSSSAR